MKTLQELQEDSSTDLPLRHYREIVLSEPKERQTISSGHGERLTAYSDGLRHHPGTRYVISKIDWNVLPEEHPLVDGAPRPQNEAHERAHIRRYALTRGRILHSLLEGHASTNAYNDTLDGIHEQLDTLDDSDEYEDAYEAVADWPASPKTDPDRTPSDHRDALREAAEMEAGEMELRWHEFRKQHDIDVLSREHIYCHKPDETRIGRGHGGQADMVVNIPRDSSIDVPAGLYAPDVKTGLEVTHAERIQAEAHRRAFSGRIGEEVGGMILHISPDGVDVETHHADSWPSDALWDTFVQKLTHLYDNTLLDVVLALAEE